MNQTETNERAARTCVECLTGKSDGWYTIAGESFCDKCGDKMEAFINGDRARQSAIVIAASECVRSARQAMSSSMGKVNKDELTEALARSRFNLHHQRELVKAVSNWHAYVTGSDSQG